jgi:hypothetical protein
MCRTNGYNFDHTLYVEGLYNTPTTVLKGDIKYVNNICGHFPVLFCRSVRQI